MHVIVSTRRHLVYTGWSVVESGSNRELRGTEPMQCPVQCCTVPAVVRDSGPGALEVVSEQPIFLLRLRLQYYSTVLTSMDSSWQRGCA